MAFGRSFMGKAKEHGFTSNPAFRSSFSKLLQGKANKKNGPGMDNARGLGQAIAAVKGRQNQQKTKPMKFINPISAAMQHSVRNRSTEQAANRSTTTSSVGAALNADVSVRRPRG